MLESKSRLRASVVCAVASLIFVVAASTERVRAEEPDLEQQIVDALKLGPVTRGLTNSADRGAASQQQQQLIESLPTARSLSTRERQEVATVTKNRPSIDLEIFFDFRSPELGDKAMPSVMALGRALTNPDLKGDVFLVAGHTDAKGNDSYNQKLSQRRAEAVKKFLVRKFKIAAQDLVTVGYGKDQLKNKDDPFAAENRRVQIVNLGANKTAEGR
jgi:outer membrane protein OmpA-like peptidoglycan-associated protein